MRIIATLLFTVLVSNSYSQSSNKIIEDCSQILNLASEQWKLDTLGCTGFRGKIFDALKKSKIDSVSKNFLIENFGKPNQISRFYSGIDNKNYIGYLYCSLNMDCRHKPFMGEYVEFVFDENEKMLLSIEVRDACR